MGFVANVLTVMIASPGDVADARDAIEKALHGWNGANSRGKQVVLLPWRWETSAVPVLGGHPQSLINGQGVDQCDIVFGLFGSRLGSPTPDAVSGTVEEIERAQELGKPVHLYFSTAPLPNDVNIKQLEGLRALKKELQERGLLGQFSNASQLEHEVWKAIEHDLAALAVAVPSLTTRAPIGVEFSVQPRAERELKGHSAKGRPQYTTRRWLEVTNTGDLDAEGVVFETAGENPRMQLSYRSGPTVIHAKQTRTVPMFYVMNGGDPAVLRIRWQEADEERTAEFHVD